jgi:hypothetical protein
MARRYSLMMVKRDLGLMNSDKFSAFVSELKVKFDKVSSYIMYTEVDRVNPRQSFTSIEFTGTKQARFKLDVVQIEIVYSTKTLAELRAWNKAFEEHPLFL